MRGTARPRRGWRSGIALALGAVAACAPTPVPRTPRPAVPVSRADAGWWRRHHLEYVERAQRGQIDILFLGDSITQGWKGTGRDAPDGDGRAIWDRVYAPRHAANFGLGSDRTQHLLWRIGHGELVGIAPRVVVLMIGGNNVPDGDEPEAIAQGVAAIVQVLRGRLPGAQVLLLGIFPRGERPGPLRAGIRAVNERIARLDDLEGVTFLDIGPQFLNADGTISREIMPDSLHLSRVGYRIWAEAMEPALQSLRTGGRDRSPDRPARGAGPAPMSPVGWPLRPGDIASLHSIAPAPQVLERIAP